MKHKRVHIDKIFHGQNCMVVYADKPDFDVIARVSGVLNVRDGDKGWAFVDTDPRYDISDIVLEIEKLNQVQTLEELLDA